ncbi:MAG: DUF1570 domain-containing protein [Planctomycetaceae bacterium]
MPTRLFAQTPQAQSNDAPVPELSHMLEEITAVIGTEERTLSGRLLATDTAGTHLFEERNATLHQIPSDAVRRRETRNEPFRYLSSEDLSAELLKQLPGGFEVTSAGPFLVCSNGSSEYAMYVGELLERVAAEYFEFWKESPVSVSAPAVSLPVIVFRTPQQYLEFAHGQHPDIEFTDVPGYYSIRFNQMLLPEGIPQDASSNRRSLLQYLRNQTRMVETIVHEGVHQLAFNTGLQVRYADNPLWMVEGLAVYFEGVSNRGTLLWSGPGLPSRTRLPAFTTAAERGTPALPLDDLISSNAPFQTSDRVAEAYAEGWALTFYLVRRNREAFDRLTMSVQQRKPVVSVSGDAWRKEFADAVQQPPEELEAELIRYMARIRPPR